MARATKTGRARSKQQGAAEAVQAAGGPASGFFPTVAHVPARQPAPPAGPPSHEEIALAAYYRFVTRGEHHADALEDWLDAERELMSLHRAASGTRA